MLPRFSPPILFDLCRFSALKSTDPQPFYVARSHIHGRGLFAARRIKKGERVGTYEGPETMRDGKYVLWVEDEEGKLFGINGKNELRFVNHSSSPNAIFYGDELVSLRAIAPGEEITFHYGEDWEDESWDEDEPARELSA